MDFTPEQGELFLNWLLRRVVEEARGEQYKTLPVAPSGKFWLGRLAPRESVLNDDRSERLMPCAVGLRVRRRESETGPIHCQVRMNAWKEIPNHGREPSDPKWEKTERIDVSVELAMPTDVGSVETAGLSSISSALEAAGASGLAVEIQAEIEDGRQGPELVVTVVNVSPVEVDGLDANLYEVELEADISGTEPFLLDSLPDSFRYDRRVPAYGVNGGVSVSESGVFRTADFTVGDQNRPGYWDLASSPEPPSLKFVDLAEDPLTPLSVLVETFEEWTRHNWNEEVLSARAQKEQWTHDMLKEAQREAALARSEVSRLREGLALLREDDNLRRAFSLANESFARTVSINYEEWRPFQLGFALANIASLPVPDGEAERDILDTLWFATGGGKTETYLLFVLTAAFYDRLKGKHFGITSWARFPLRMLSLQQTQRFADVLAAAELTRLRHGLSGDPFRLGFFVGGTGSPNQVIRNNPNARASDITDSDLQDPEVRERYRILIHCPFCNSPDPEVRFNTAQWSLEHHCVSPSCPWAGKALPIHIVDYEIYRFLPTVVLGTLDKAAIVSMQGAMRGFYGPPKGLCHVPGHGFTYARRGGATTGCLFPDCREQPQQLPQDPRLFAPSIRMQDELHLLRDSLGSIDSHYEAILDDLQKNWSSKPKLIASSATLAGHSEQARTLYRRNGRIFPMPGPWSSRSFWSQDSEQLARRYVGLSPRGVTLEFANDQLWTTIQSSVRDALANPEVVAKDVGVEPHTIEHLIRAYGLGVTYGSTLKDVEAASRSFEAQIDIPDLNTATLTGRSQLAM